MPNMINTVSGLFEKAEKDVTNYPETMLPIPEIKEIFLFFPGGCGTLDKSIDIINKKFKYVFVGQDFGTKELYTSRETIEGNKNYNPTVNNVCKFIDALKIQKNDCFFTNAFMGMRKDGKMTGKSPGWRDPDFKKKCQEFLKYQISILQPEIVFLLGSQTASFISETYNVSDWEKIKDVKSLFKSGKFYKTIGGAKFIYMTHPSLRPTNISKRWGLEGDKELLLTRRLIDSLQ